MGKVIVAEFTTNDIGAVDTHLIQELDLEVGKLRYGKNEARKTVEAQFFLDEELSERDDLVDWMAQSSQVIFGSMFINGLIGNFEGVSIRDASEIKRVDP